MRFKLTYIQCQLLQDSRHPVERPYATFAPAHAKLVRPALTSDLQGPSVDSTTFLQSLSTRRFADYARDKEGRKQSLQHPWQPTRLNGWNSVCSLLHSLCSRSCTNQTEEPCEPPARCSTNITTRDKALHNNSVKHLDSSLWLGAHALESFCDSLKRRMTPAAAVILHHELLLRGQARATFLLSLSWANVATCSGGL